MNVSSQFLFNELKNQLNELKQKILDTEKDFDRKVEDGTIGAKPVIWVGTDGKRYETKIPQSGIIRLFDSVNGVYPVEIVDWGKSNKILKIDIDLGATNLKEGVLEKVPSNAPSWSNTLAGLFMNQHNFNDPNVVDWDTSNVTNMNSMFYNATNFNQPIGNWDTSRVTIMFQMFYNATNFNQPIGDWNTSRVTTMGSMFYDAKSFNQPIGNWNTSRVNIMSSMFNRATNFNQPIGNWNTSRVTTMFQMFYNATNFNQDLSQWCVEKIPTKPSTFDLGASSWTLPRPVWGTCPRGEDIN